MVAGRRRFGSAIKKIDVVKEDIPNEFSGILGISIGGQRVVQVPGRDGYVYVRLRDDLSELIQAYNDEVSAVYDLAVIVIRDKVDRTRYRIKGRDLGRYQIWGTAPYLPFHGATHQFSYSAPGADPVWVYGRQMMPLAAVPSGSSAGPNVVIQEATYYQNNHWIHAGGTGTADIVPGCLPTGSFSRMVLVYMDGSGNPQITCGSQYFDPSITGVAAVVPYIPNLPITSGIPIAGVRIPSGTTTINWNNIYDVRPWIIGDGFIPTGTTGHIIEDDGAPLANRPSLNFVGNGFVTWNTGTDTVVSGTATSALFPQTRIPFAGTDMYLTSNGYLWAYDHYNHSKKGVMIGGLGDGIGYYPLYKMTLIVDDGEYGSLGLFGYDTQYSMFETFHARGTEASPSGTTTNDEIFQWNFLGYRAPWSDWYYCGRWQVTADQNFDENGFGTRFDWALAATGSTSVGKAIRTRRYRTEFGGSVTTPTGTSAHPEPSYYFGEPNSSGVYLEGTWRMTRSGDDLVMQRLESGSWVTKSTVSA